MVRTGVFECTIIGVYENIMKMSLHGCARVWLHINVHIGVSPV